MNFQIKDIKNKFTTPTLVLTYFSKDKPEVNSLWKFLSATDKKQLVKLFRTREFTGASKQSLVFFSTGGKIILVGLGKKEKWTSRELILTARLIVVLAKQNKIKSFALALENLASSGYSLDKVAQTVAENMIMADYAFTQYKKDKGEDAKLSQITFLVSKLALSSVKNGWRIGEVVGRWTNYARDLGNIPGGEMTPTLLADRAKEVGRANNIKVTVLNRKQMGANKMGAILGVAKGSAEEPKFIIMEYWGADKSDKPYVFVGKGVTFDSGGVNLKPGSGLEDMWLDMLGGAAVIASLGVAAELKLPVNIVGLIPAVENMLGSASFRPGDLLRSMSGKTIEVLNTDAEGRIILADALTYAAKYNPKIVLDVATLTGACMVALGLKMSGVFTPDDKLGTKLFQIGQSSGDYVWQLPLTDEFEDEVKGTFGDVQNVGRTRYGDAINGAAFLWQFAKKYPWVHLDIAGTMKTVEGQYLAKGASGVGVRYLIELVRVGVKS